MSEPRFSFDVESKDPQIAARTMPRHRWYSERRRCRLARRILEYQKDEIMHSAVDAMKDLMLYGSQATRHLWKL